MVEYFCFLGISSFFVLFCFFSFYRTQGMSLNYWENKEYKLLRNLCGLIGTIYLVLIIIVGIVNNFSKESNKIIILLMGVQLLSMLIFSQAVHMVAWIQKNKILKNNIKKTLLEKVNIIDRNEVYKICLMENRNNFSVNQIERVFKEAVTDKKHCGNFKTKRNKLTYIIYITSLIVSIVGFVSSLILMLVLGAKQLDFITFFAITIMFLSSSAFCVFLIIKFTQSKEYKEILNESTINKKYNQTPIIYTLNKTQSLNNVRCLNNKYSMKYKPKNKTKNPKPTIQCSLRTNPLQSIVRSRIVKENSFRNKGPLLYKQKYRRIAYKDVENPLVQMSLDMRNNSSSVFYPLSAKKENMKQKAYNILKKKQFQSEVLDNGDIFYKEEQNFYNKKKKAYDIIYLLNKKNKNSYDIETELNNIEKYVRDVDDFLTRKNKEKDFLEVGIIFQDKKLSEQEKQFYYKFPGVRNVVLDNEKFIKNTSFSYCGMDESNNNFYFYQPTKRDNGTEVNLNKLLVENLMLSKKI